MCHFAEQISQYGNILNYSTASCKPAHRYQITIPYRWSNRVDPAMEVHRMFNCDHTFSICELLVNLLQIVQNRFSTSELIGNLDVLQPHLKRRIHATRPDFRDPHDYQVFQAHGILSPVYLTSDRILGKKWVKRPVKLTNVQGINIPVTKIRLANYI